MAPHDLIPFGSRDWWLTVPPTVAVCGMLLLLPRFDPRFKSKRFAHLAAGLLVANVLAGLFIAVRSGRYSYADYLPLHLCSITSLMAPAVLWRPSQTLVELLYFWGVAGGVQSLLTPEFTMGRTGFMEFNYFASHASIVFVPVYLIRHYGLRPRPKAWLRAFLWIQVLAAGVGTINYLIGSNYMFLSQAPAVDSPFVMGRWPWYILGFEGLALAQFYLLGWPFRQQQAPLPD